MNSSLTPAQQEIREAILKICARFGDDYWLARDTDGAFPHEFHKALAEAGWLGIAMPEAYGGSGLGITEAAIMMQAIAESGAAFSGASAVHMNIFGLNPVVVFGTEEQKRRFLPPLIAGKEKACFAVTEPDAGLDTTRLKTRAVRHGNGYAVHGQKIWISTAQVAERVLLLARTTPARGGEEAHRGSLALLHRARPQLRRGARHRQDGPQGGRLQPAVLRRPAGAAGGPHRRGRQGLRVHPARHEPGAHPDRGRGGRHRPGGAGARHALRQGAHRVRPADRPEPGDPAPARQVLDGARGGQPDDAEGGRTSTTPASPAASRPTRPSIWAPRPASRPARRRC